MPLVQDAVVAGLDRGSLRLLVFLSALAVLTRRAARVERLYADGDPEVIRPG